MSTPTQERLLYLLKTRGPMTAGQLAEVLELTSMGARRQLETAETDGLVHHEDRQAGKGRPARWWALSKAGHARFPDRHGEVVVQLLSEIQAQFGAGGVEQLIAAREANMQQQYRAALGTCKGLQAKLSTLAAVRTREGYMAELVASTEAKGETAAWLLIEHHCPICVAATQCQGFCRSELNLFRQLVPEADWQRTEHLMNAGTRCVYRITPK